MIFISFDPLEQVKIKAKIRYHSPKHICLGADTSIDLYSTKENKTLRADDIYILGFRLYELSTRLFFPKRAFSIICGF